MQPSTAEASICASAAKLRSTSHSVCIEVGCSAAATAYPKFAHQLLKRMDEHFLAVEGSLSAAEEHLRIASVSCHPTATK